MYLGLQQPAACWPPAPAATEGPAPPPWRRSCLGARVTPGVWARPSYVPLPEFVRQMITRAPRERHDGPRGILTRRADVARAVDDKQVPDVMRLLKLVQHRGLGIVAHARRAQLVDRPPLREHFLVRPHNLDPGRLEHFAARRDHVLGHLALVVREVIVEAQHRDPPGVLRLGIQVDVALVARQDFAEGPHTDECPGMIAHAPFELAAEARRVHDVRREHGMAAVPLVAVASDEPGLAVLQVPEAGDVEPSRPAVIEGVRLAHELLDQPGNARTHHVLAEVVTDLPARVAEAAGMLGGT